MSILFILSKNSLRHWQCLVFLTAIMSAVMSAVLSAVLSAEALAKEEALA